MLWLRDLKLTGKRATEKFIPPEIHALDNENLALFLGKLWQGDGCVSIKNHQLYYATSSLQMARELQHLLLRFGMVSTLHSKKFKYRGTLRDGFTVVVTHRENILLFAAEIGKHFVGNKQLQLQTLAERAKKSIQRLGFYPARGTKDVIPAPVLTLLRKGKKPGKKKTATQHTE